MGKLATPFRVGILVIVTLVAFAIAFTFLNKGGLSHRDAARAYAYFHDASGLGPKSRIQIAGILVGEIESIQLEGQLARVTLLVKRDIKLKTDATLAKRSESLLGDFMLDLTPGSEKADMLEDGGQITHVQDTTGMEQAFNSLSKITGDIQEVTAALRVSLGGDKGALSLSHIIQNLSQMSDQLNDTVRMNGERLNDILTNFQGVSSDVRSITSSEEQRYKVIVENVQTITEDVKDVLVQVKKVLGAGEGNMKDTVDSLKETLTKLNSSLENVQEITGRINKGEGTLGQLINDKKMGQAITDTVLDASDYFSRLVTVQTELAIRSEYLINQGTSKSYLQLKLIPKPDRFYTIEIVDDPRGLTTEQVIQKNPPGSTEVAQQIVHTTTQSLKYSVQFNQRYYFATVHFGIIESTGGAGVDLHFLDDALTFKVDAFAFTEQSAKYPRLKAFVNYSFLGHIFVTGGIDDALNNPFRDPVSRQLLSGRDYFVGGGVYFNDDTLKSVISTVGAVKF